MDSCIASMYIPGLECIFTNNNEGVALVQMNTPEINITAIEVELTNWMSHNQLVFTLHMKADTTDDEHTALFNTVDAPLQGASGKTYDVVLPTKYVAVAGNEYWRGMRTTHAENEYWGRLFAAQSRVFTPFESRPTCMVMVVVENVDVDTGVDVSDVIEALFGLLGIFRDADTKPARMC